MTTTKLEPLHFSSKKNDEGDDKWFLVKHGKERLALTRDRDSLIAAIFGRTLLETAPRYLKPENFTVDFAREDMSGPFLEHFARLWNEFSPNEKDQMLSWNTITRALRN